MLKFLIAVSIFLFSYLAIATEKLPSSMVVVLGSTLMIATGVLSSEEALAAIDFEILALLLGMMIMVAVIAETGIFEWIAIKIAQLVKGFPFPLLIVLSLMTAFLSAFLDNVTTIMVLTPITILLAKQLDITPVPFVISQAIASNIGGASTLIGDPPNLIVAAYSGYTFNDFLFNLVPISIMNMVVFCVISWLFFRKRLKVTRYRRAQLMDMDPTRAIGKFVALKRSLSIFSLVLLSFLLHRVLNLSPAVSSLLGAAFMVIVTGKNPEKILHKVEWNTILFFAGLFVLVGGLNKVGLLKMIGEFVLVITGGSLALTSMMVLWVSSIVSSLLDNIPFTATIAPMIKNSVIPEISHIYGDIPLSVIKGAMWWALSLGACLGGNGTLIGASANILASDISKKSGYKISFMEFTKYGIVFSIATTAVSAFYIWARYLV